MKKIGLLLLTFTLGFGIVRCNSTTDSKTGVGTGTANTYATTSNVGDYAEWSVAGNTLNATWKNIDATGATSATYTVVATCGTADSTYGHKTCTIDTGSSSCTGTCTGAPSGSFHMMEVPGVALFVHTGSGTSQQLHVGFLKDSDSCSKDMSGDYVFMKTAVGNSDIFGMYRADSNLINVTHADFKMQNTTSQATTPTLTYSTGTASEVLGDGGCTGGVRTRTVGGGTIRGMMTQSGLFILDMPEGQGGLVSYKTTVAATLADLAGKSFGGITFPDNGGPELLSATTGTITSNSLPITANVGGNTQTGMEIRPLTNATTNLTNPAYANFAAAPAGYTAGANVLAATYATPSTFPGMFRMDNTMADSGRLLISFIKYNSKVIGFGVVFNYRTNGQTKPNGSTYTSNNVYNTGSFILFEK